MKVKDVCAGCGKKHRKITVEIDPSERDAFIAFSEKVQRDMAAQNPQKASQLFIPPTKYPKAPLLIPGPGQNPCHDCKFGADSVGPSGCGRGGTCIALYYYRLFQLNNLTVTEQVAPKNDPLEVFLCAVPTATWLAPKSKKRVKSAAAEWFLKSKNSSATRPPESSKKSASPSSKWPASSKKRSGPKSTRSSKPGSARAKRSRT